MSEHPVGQPAEVVVTDPWEFMSEVGTTPLRGRVTLFEERDGRVVRIVVSLLDPISYRGRQIGSVDATPRHRGGPSAEAVAQGAGMPANMEGKSGVLGQPPAALVGEIRVL